MKPGENDSTLDVVMRAVGGRYRDLQLLGQGGMGVVYRAYDVDLDRVVAVKVILTVLSSDAKVRERFQREIRAMALVNHPSVVRLFDCQTRGGVTWFTMDYVEGTPLDGVIDGGPMAVSAAVRLGVDLFDGLAAVHEAGLVHRDIKPANIVVQPDGRPVLMDFGLVKFLDGQSVTALTKTGQIVGTLKYMPPEIFFGDRSDYRADIYQVGLVLYEALVGEAPFQAKAVHDLMRHFEKQFVAAPKVPGVDEVLADFLTRSMAVDADDRPASAAGARDELRQWLAERERDGDEVRLPEEVTETVRFDEPPLDGEGGLTSRRRYVAAGCLILVVVLSVLVGMRLRGPRSAGLSAVPTVPATVAAVTSVVADECDGIGWTALHHAAWDGGAVADVGGAVDACDDYGWTPLHLAAIGGHAGAATELLRAGAPVDAADMNGRTPLSWAAERGHQPMVRLLVEGGAEVGRRDTYGRTALHMAARAGKRAVAALLMQRGAVVDGRDRAGQTPLFQAADAGAQAVVELLLDAGAAIDVVDARGRTPLLAAANQHHGDVSLFLIAAGADVRPVDFAGMAVIHMAARRGLVKVVERLVAAKADLTRRSNEGMTPRQYALWHRRAETAALLERVGE